MSHSAFDLMVEFGFKNIALVGQDLALASSGKLYAEDTDLDMSEFRLQAMGERFKVKGFMAMMWRLIIRFTFCNPIKTSQLSLRIVG